MGKHGVAVAVGCLSKPAQTKQALCYSLGIHDVQLLLAVATFTKHKITHRPFFNIYSYTTQSFWGKIYRSEKPQEMMTHSEQKWGKAPQTLIRAPQHRSTKAVMDCSGCELYSWGHGSACCRLPPALTVRDSLPAVRQRGLLQTSALVFLRGPRPLTLVDSCTGVAVTRKRTAWPRSLRGRICFAWRWKKKKRETRWKDVIALKWAVLLMSAPKH